MMDSLLLTPEEQRPYIHYSREAYGDVSLTICDVDTEGLLKAQLVAVVKWLEEPCLIHHHEEGEVTKHMDCPECWQYLKGLVK